MTAALLLTGMSSLPTSCGSRTGLFVDDAAELAAVQDAGVDGDTGDTRTVACTSGNFGLNKANPAAMFVLDRSRSMTDRFGAGRSRCNVLTNALASSLPPVDDTMAIGALLYPARGSNTVSTQCTVASRVRHWHSRQHRRLVGRGSRCTGRGGRSPAKRLAHRYFAASSEAELDAALVAIREQVAVYTFFVTSVPDASGTITITLGGEGVPYDEIGTNGWPSSNRDNGEIRFVGDACSRAVVSSRSAQATFSCGPPDAASDGEAADADANADDAGDFSAADSGDNG